MNRDNFPNCVSLWFSRPWKCRVYGFSPFSYSVVKIRNQGLDGGPSRLPHRVGEGGTPPCHSSLQAERRLRYRIGLHRLSGMGIWVGAF